MDRFENELKNALRRRKPLEGFESRVAARVAGAARRPWWTVPAHWPLRWAAVAVMCLTAAGTFTLWRQHELERLRGEQAKAQVMTALQIAGAKLRFAQNKVQNLSQRDEEELR